VPELGQLPAAVLGNGSLLATISARGVVEQLWWPHPDRARHDLALRTGVEVDGEVHWLDDESFEWSQTYADGAMVLRSCARNHVVDVELVDLVVDGEPVLLRRVSSFVPGARVRVECNSAGAQPAVRLDERHVVCAFGATAEQAAERAERFAGVPFEEVSPAPVREARPPVERSAADLYRRSLLVFDALADRATGAVIAAPELDPARVHSGGYGFVWARDLAYLTLAFLASGRHDLARPALRWFPTAQEPSGVWLQRHWTDGSAAPSWCADQLDETAAVLVAYEAGWLELRDAALDAELWPSARAAADFLVGSLDDRSLPRNTFDLWEERQGCHAYTAASFVGGLGAAAAMARRHEPELADGYAFAATCVGEATDRWFWSDEHGRYLRTLGDPTVDVSLLGLAWPFRAVDPAGERMRSTAAAVEAELSQLGGGMLRYAGDTYAGGNSWVLARLWFGLWRRQIGDANGHREALAYAERVASPLGLLAEQVSTEGCPVWVLPLAWSHAMLVLASRPELDVVVT
jgi:GH15 family glucan-1,4-alpha-glucosidase